VSDFDHDASMSRGAARQQLVEGTQRDFFQLLDESTGHENHVRIRGPSTDRLVLACAILLLQELAEERGDFLTMENKALVAEFAAKAVDRIGRFCHVHEGGATILDLAMKLLGTGTASFRSEFNRWESDFFQKKPLEYL
jgi:hypothetical protein